MKTTRQGRVVRHVFARLAINEDGFRRLSRDLSHALGQRVRVRVALTSSDVPEEQFDRLLRVYGGGHEALAEFAIEKRNAEVMHIALDRLAKHKGKDVRVTINGIDINGFATGEKVEVVNDGKSEQEA